MSSIRISADLLARLHAAAPAGFSLSQVIGWLLERSGGPDAVRERIEQDSRKELARVQVARLRNKGHRSVILLPDEQVSLAEATATWVSLLEKADQRVFDPRGRTLMLRRKALKGSTRGKSRMQIERTGM